MRLKTEEETSEQIQRQKIILYKKVFGSKDGKEVLLDLINRNYVLQSTGGDSIKEGRRSAVLDIIHLSKISLKSFDELLTAREGD